MTISSRKYYAVKEAINYLNQQNISLDLVGLQGFIREKLIHPIIYIDSKFAYACEEASDHKPLVVGACYLSAYLNINHEIIGIFDKLLQSETVKIQNFIDHELLIEKPTITGWNCDDTVFSSEIPSTHLQPKLEPPDNTKIIGYLLDNNEISIKNILITHKDLTFLMESQNKKDLANNNAKNNGNTDTPQSKRERNNLLKIIAAMACDGYGKKDLAKLEGLPKEIEKATEKIGAHVSDDKIAAVLKEAGEFVQPQSNKIPS